MVITVIISVFGGKHNILAPHRDVEVPRRGYSAASNRMGYGVPNCDAEVPVGIKDSQHAAGKEEGEYQVPCV